MGEDAYKFTESAFAFGASAMIPIAGAYNAATLTWRSGAVIVGEEAISEIVYIIQTQIQ